jgi:hypothetical protein
MATLEELQAEKSALESARNSGALRVRHGEKDITYRSVAEINSALSSLNNAIGRLSGKKRTRQVRIYTDRGLG